MKLGIALAEGKGVGQEENEEGHCQVENKERFPAGFDSEREYHTGITFGLRLSSILL